MRYLIAAIIGTFMGLTYFYVNDIIIPLLFQLVMTADLHINFMEIDPLIFTPLTQCTEMDLTNAPLLNFWSKPNSIASLFYANSDGNYQNIYDDYANMNSIQIITLKCIATQLAYTYLTITPLQEILNFFYLSLDYPIQINDITITLDLFFVWLHIICLAILTIWARGVGPRFRPDQLSTLTWKDLILFICGLLILFSVIATLNLCGI